MKKIKNQELKIFHKNFFSCILKLSDSTEMFFDVILLGM